MRTPAGSVADRAREKLQADDDDNRRQVETRVAPAHQHASQDHIEVPTEQRANDLHEGNGTGRRS